MPGWAGWAAEASAAAAVFTPRGSVAAFAAEWRVVAFAAPLSAVEWWVVVSAAPLSAPQWSVEASAAPRAGVVSWGRAASRSGRDLHRASIGLRSPGST